MWSIRDRQLPLDRPVIVGILNVTPDSFSDGGTYLTPNAAVTRACQMMAEGVDLIDIGGESTRPKAINVPLEEELRRVLPVVQTLRREYPNVALSVDTTKSDVARAALAAGAHVINDVSGGRLDMHMCDVVASARAGIILMHSRGGVDSMASYQWALYGEDPVRDIMHEMNASAERALDSGIPRDAIVLDPGIGFAKRSEHSIAVLQQLQRIAGLGYPLLVGASRKRVVGELSGVDEPDRRLAGTIAAHVTALMNGARLFRVHDVRAHREALSVAWALRAQQPHQDLTGPGSC
jgi:dihydropteroate synthase